MKKNSGFTLLELMIVIAILAIVSAITVPNMVAWQNKRKISKAAIEVYSMLQYIKMAATKQSSDITISFSTRKCIAFIDIDADGIKDENEDAIEAVEMPGEVKLKTDFAPPFNFNNRGLPSSSGTIDLTDPDDDTIVLKSVRVTLTGNIRIL